MNWLAVISQLVIPLISEIPAIIKAWDSAPSGGLDKVKAVVEGSPLSKVLADIGGLLFPKLSPDLHAAAAALVVAHPNNSAWVQSALNMLKAAHVVDFGADLAVDGLYGPKTHAAVEALQAKLHIQTTGFVSDLEYNAISALLAKL